MNRKNSLKTKTPLKRKTPLRAKPKEKSKFEVSEVKVKKKVPNKWSKKKLVEKLDRIFSQYIRLKYSDSRGICQCISCMKRQPWNEIQNGHYMSKKPVQGRKLSNMESLNLTQ